jgi:hypothetical protein
MNQQHCCKDIISHITDICYDRDLKATTPVTVLNAMNRLLPVNNSQAVDFLMHLLKVNRLRIAADTKITG